MPNSVRPNRIHPVSVLAGLLLASLVSPPVLPAGQLSTLFTTPQERQLINSNRYRRDEVKVQAVNVEPDDSPIQMLVREEVSVDYRVSGISLATDGAHTAWVNAVAYEDGAQLEDGSRIKIFAGDDIRVRITAPDGKQYFAKSGETLTVTYMAAVEN